MQSRSGESETRITNVYTPKTGWQLSYKDSLVNSEIDDLNKHILAVLNKIVTFAETKSDPDILYVFKTNGVWETWLQSELAWYLTQHVGGTRTEPVYTDGSLPASLVHDVPPTQQGIPKKLIIELKCQHNRQDLNDMNSFHKEFLADVDKISSNPRKDEYKAYPVVMIGFGVVSGIKKDPTNAMALDMTKIGFMISPAREKYNVSWVDTKMDFTLFWSVIPGQ